MEVAQRLARRTLPEGVRVVDFGIRALDLTYALLNGYDAAVLVDTARRGEAPGTVYVIEPERPAEGVPARALKPLDLARPVWSRASRFSFASYPPGCSSPFGTPSSLKSQSRTTMTPTSGSNAGLRTSPTHSGLAGYPFDRETWPTALESGC